MLISAILSEIITEIGGDADDTTLASLLLTCFKGGRRRVPVYINDRSFLGRDEFTLSAGAYNALLSNLDGFVKERSLWWVNTDQSRVPIVPPPSMRYFHNIIRPLTPGKPVYYNIYAGYIEFNVAADIGLTIGADYFKEVSSIVATDTFIGDEQMVEISKDFAKMVYYKNYEEDKDKAREHERSGKDMMAQKEGDYEEQTQGGHIEPSQGD